MSKERTRLLRELRIDDNIHSKIQDDLWNDVESTKPRRKREHRSGSVNSIKEEQGFVKAPRQNISNYSFEGDLNTLNPSVQFSEGNKIVTIRYDPVKLLDFEQVMNRRSNVVDPVDFEIHETETLITSLDNNCQLPYRGAIESKQDYSTAKTVPRIKDREYFQRLLLETQYASRINANTLLAFPNEDNKKKTKPAEQSQTSSTNVEYIYFQDFEIKAWYKAPYPEEYNKNKILYICHKCLKYMNSKYVYFRHQLKCDYSNPPGNQIYRDMAQGFSIWEVDGRENVIYCQNLCLLAKLFLNSKTLYYDVEPFMFYIITVWEQDEWKFVGYFSKEKLNSTDYNLSCILTLPHYQRRGIGNLLMDFSYLLSMREFKLGTPEKPLSDLGLISYRNFWKSKMIQTLYILFKEFGDSLICSIDDLSNLTGMNHSDVIYGLEQIGCISKYKDDESNRWKYAVKINNWDKLCVRFEKWKSKMKYTLDPKKLIWKPVIFGPSCGINAVGTMVETNTGQQRNTSGSGLDKDNDLFKQSISILTSFMRDDLSDSRDMEQTAMDKIRQQSKFVPLDDKPLMMAYRLPKSVYDKILKASKIKQEARSVDVKELQKSRESADPQNAAQPELECFNDVDINTEERDNAGDEEGPEEDFSEDNEEEDYSEDEDDEDEEDKKLIIDNTHTRSGRSIRRPKEDLVSDDEGNTSEIDISEPRRVLRNRSNVDKPIYDA